MYSSEVKIAFPKLSIFIHAFKEINECAATRLHNIPFCLIAKSTWTPGWKVLGIVADG